MRKAEESSGRLRKAEEGRGRQRKMHTMASIPISTHAVVFHGPWSGMLIEKPKMIAESMAAHG